MEFQSQNITTDHLPPSPWEELSLQKWGDWRWQLANCLNTVQDFESIINLSDDEKAGLEASSQASLNNNPFRRSP